MPAAPPFCHGVALVKSTPAQLRKSTACWPYEPGIPPGASWPQLPMLSRLTVPPLRSVITSAPPLAALGTWNSLRWEWPPKSGSWSMMRIFLSGPKRSWYHFAAEIPLAPAPTITQSYFSRVSLTCAWMPGPPLVEWICDGFDGGGPSILIVRRITWAGSPVYGSLRVGG